MDRNQTSQGAHTSVLSSNNRQLFVARLFLMALLLVMGLQITASAQDCSQQCQQAYVECLRGALGNPGPLAVCDDQYDACWQLCL
jgi:hypothetical protein